jgi:endoglucanase Acf2
VLPHWPGIKNETDASKVSDLLKIDLRKRRELIPVRENKDDWRVSAYWQGKGLTRATQLAAVAEQQGDLAARDQLLTLVKDRMEWWFGGAGRSYFHHNKGLGSVITYPDEFFAAEEMNDHHFHYGYWIRAAAEIALRDPAWAAKERWGGMVELLVADIATPERGRTDFPFLRPFDQYSGFSMASGVGLYDFGNGQESTSEAINAWASLILWGEATGNTQLRDLGIYLYTTEIDAVNHYWFDVHGLVFPPEYKNIEVSWVFGGRYAHKTWWTDEPRQIKGINLLPVTTFSTYLGADPAYVKRNVAALKPETENYNAIGKFPPNPPPKDIWQDIFSKYLALVDPAAALAQWDRHGSVESGETRTHTLHWMLSLQEMGTPDFSVTANTTLYSVFKRPDGRKTYLAYNASKAPIQVKFSDGKTLSVAPGALGRL